MPLDQRTWEQTPYAKSDAKDADRALMLLLDKYKISERQWTDHAGEHGRPACTLAFITGGKKYRITIETLDAPRIDRAQLTKQVKRVMFWTLKPLLENAMVFGGNGEGLQRLLLPFLVDSSGATVYEQMRPFLPEMKATALIGVAKQMALPAPEGTR